MRSFRAITWVGFFSQRTSHDIGHPAVARMILYHAVRVVEEAAVSLAERQRFPFRRKRLDLGRIRVIQRCNTLHLSSG
jgi:hypothetical protein